MQTFLANFPYYETQADPERGTLMFRHPEQFTPDNSEPQDLFFSVEQLTAMVLEFAKEVASADEAAEDVVIAVPPYFTTPQRRAVLDAAAMVDL